MRAIAAIFCAIALAFLWLTSSALAYTGGQQIDYATGSNGDTSATSSTPNPVMTTGSDLYDGSTRVYVQWFVPVLETSSANTEGDLAFREDGTTVGLVCDLFETSGAADSTCSGGEYLTPTSGSHTFSIGVERVGGSGTVDALCSGLWGTCWIRITDAADPSGGGGSGSSTLAGDTDVNLGTPADGDVLQYNGSTSKWVSSSPTVDTTLTDGFNAEHSGQNLIVGAICALPVAFALLLILRGRRS